jgi:hypothetical protein
MPFRPVLLTPSRETPKRSPRVGYNVGLHGKYAERFGAATATTKEES